MSENETNKPEKPGFFGRLFGRETKTEPQNAPEAQQEAQDISQLKQPEAEIAEPDNIAQKEDQTQNQALDQEAPKIEEKVSETTIEAPLSEPEKAETDEPQEEVQQEAKEEEPQKTSWFGRLKAGLSKSSSKLSEGITGLFTKAKLDEDTLQDLEDLLIQADLGVDTAMRITDELSKSRHDKNISAEDVSQILANEVEKVLTPVTQPLEINPELKPHVILTVGVNGSGKTTTIGKLAQKYVGEGKKVMLAAGDTFRAAAIEQLKIWGERTNSPVIAKDHGADAAGLAFDALKQAKDENYDVLLIDTAGRLQNKANLMAELEKVVRVIKKFDETAPHTVLLVLDATTGQNALSQVEIFSKTAGVTGLIMTKLDGTARGGILVAIANKYSLPVHAIGVGEGIDDLQSFDAGEFAKAIAASQ